MCKLLLFPRELHGDGILSRGLPGFLVPTTTLEKLCIRFFIHLASGRLYPRSNSRARHSENGRLMPLFCKPLIIHPAYHPIASFFLYFLLSSILRFQDSSGKSTFSSSLPLKKIFFPLFFFFSWRAFLSFKYLGLQVLHLWGYFLFACFKISFNFFFKLTFSLRNFLFPFFFFWPRGMWDLSSPTRV